MRTLLLSLLAWFGLAAAQGQEIPKEARLDRNWSFSHYQKSGNQKVLRALFSGKDAVPAQEGEVLVKRFEMKNFRNGDPNQVQIIARAPECLFDIETHVAHSTNRLEVFTATTNFHIQGRGFYCTQSNAMLIISNDVQTRFQKALIKSSTLSSASNPTNNILKILSDHFQILYESNLVIYTGNVRVIDPQLQLNCDQLVGRYNTNRFQTNAGIEQITAVSNVVILTPHKGRATGDKAVYLAREGVETIDLTGHAVWNDGQREAQATRFTFDRNRNLLQADGEVRVKFPDGMLTRTNGAANPLMAARSDSSTNNYTELLAEHVTVQLASTNAPPEWMLAENNVVITNRADASRATGQKAFYTATNEQVELTGDPIFESAKVQLYGRLLAISGRTNQVLRSVGDARVRLNLDQQGLVKASKTRSKRAGSTNSVLEIASDIFEYRTNVATFTKDVHARALNGSELQAMLDCQLLKICFSPSNRVQAVVARDQVRGSQPPLGPIEKRTIACESLTVHFWPESEYVRDARAEGNVSTEQVGPAPKSVKLNAELVTAQFAAASNVLEHAEAETNVHGEQDEGKGKVTEIRGDRAVYTMKNAEPVRITGNPQIRYWRGTDPNAKASGNSETSAPAGVLVSNAQSLVWDPKTKNFRAQGPYRIQPIPARTNSVVPFIRTSASKP